MNLQSLFDAVARGELSPTDAVRRATTMTMEDSRQPPSPQPSPGGGGGESRAGESLGFACVDHDRARRCGFPEVVFAAGKTPAQTVAIAERLRERHGFVLITRASPDTVDALRLRWPDADHNPAARSVLLGTPPVKPGAGLVLVVAAGTSDLPVAEEARVTALAMGCPVESLYDVGVAGIHRLLAHEAKLRSAAALVVVAGMEGALPSVVGGLVSVPVIAVPTSVGYGASFGGLAALLGMLNSCASGVAVVNIDNGFGGGAVAARVALARLSGGETNG